MRLHRTAQPAAKNHAASLASLAKPPTETRYAKEQIIIKWNIIGKVANSAARSAPVKRLPLGKYGGGMINWYLNINKVVREIRRKSYDAIIAIREKELTSALKIKGYIKTDYESMSDIWKEQLSEIYLGNLGRHLHFAMEGDYEDVIRRDLPELEELADRRVKEYLNHQPNKGFENLLSPLIIEKSYPQFLDGHLRDAVVDSIIAVFDSIRIKSGLDIDGESLAGRVLSPTNPILVLSDLTTESGKNDQAGFMQIFQGAYKGIRNSKAHSLNHNLTEEKAAQYLVFASILARRIEESTKV
jgi:uncharacterized protein (TIGR02391 family)